MIIEELIGIGAGVFTTIAVLPQIFKAIKTRKVDDVSPFMFMILCLGVGLWTIYGVMKNDWPIILTNGISFIFNGIMLYIVLINKKDNLFNLFLYQIDCPLPLTVNFNWFWIQRNFIFPGCINSAIINSI